jgi:hypothetical protein
MFGKRLGSRKSSAGIHLNDANLHAEMHLRAVVSGILVKSVLGR